MTNTKLGTAGSETEFTKQPIITTSFKEIVKEKAAINGTPLWGFLGVQLQATLDWSGGSSLNATQYEALRDEFKKIQSSATATLNFIPWPDDYPNTDFNVRIVGGLNFTRMRGVSGFRWQGQIQLVGTDILTEPPEWA